MLVMVRWDSRQERRMDWLLVSKTVVRLSRVRIFRPESVERGMLFLTLRSTVAMLCCEQNPD